MYLSNLLLGIGNVGKHCFIYFVPHASFLGLSSWSLASYVKLKKHLITDGFLLKYILRNYSPDEMHIEFSKS